MTSTDQVPSEVKELAGVLFDDVERIAECGLARMQEVLPSYAKVPAEKLVPVTLTIARHLLEAVRDQGADAIRAEDHFRLAGEVRLGQGIAADEMLQAWRILLEVLREEARPVAGRLGIGDGALLDFVEATLHWGDVGMRKSASAFREAEIRELERLADDQAALRRVATLVAGQAPQVEIFNGIAEECARLFGTPAIEMFRYDGDSIVVVASTGAVTATFPRGSRHRLGGENMATRILQTGTGARLDDYDAASGPIAESGRAIGLRSVLGHPIVVDGQLWGGLVLAITAEAPLPPETEARLGEFTALMATAIANTESRARAERLTNEQAALRRVATLVAETAPPSAVFDAVVAEMERLLRALAVTLIRYEPANEVTFLAHRGLGGQLIPPGTRASHADGQSATAIVRRTKRPARHVHADGAPGALAAIAIEMGFQSSVGVPLVVEGNLWGCILASWGNDVAPPIETEERMVRFSQLLATAIANAESRGRVDRLAVEQAALRRVATLVARECPPEEVFGKVAEEVGVLLAADVGGVWRYESDGQATFVATWGDLGPALTVDSRWKLDGDSVTALVYRTERSARFDAYDQATGAIGAEMRKRGVRSTVASPVFVSGRLWGVVGAASKTDPMPADAEMRIVKFAELVSTAISNIESRVKV
jgi:GAF domain-containing protein